MIHFNCTALKQSVGILTFLHISIFHFVFCVHNPAYPWASSTTGFKPQLFQAPLNILNTFVLRWTILSSSPFSINLPRGWWGGEVGVRKCAESWIDSARGRYTFMKLRGDICILARVKPDAQFANFLQQGSGVKEQIQKGWRIHKQNRYSFSLGYFIFPFNNFSPMLFLP